MSSTAEKRTLRVTDPLPAVSVSGLTKRFDDVLALDEVTFDIPRGSVFALLGPNGAGKTTLIRVLCGLSPHFDGSATIFGAPSGSRAARERSGLLSDVPGLFSWMDARETLRFTGGLYGLRRRVIEERSAVLLEMAGLADVRGRVGGFSRGMRQRLGLASALMGAPDLLVLDEPTSALDPLGRRAVLDMIGSLQGRTTVLFSTHVLADAQEVSDHVGIIDRGRLLRCGALHELLSHSETPVLRIQPLADPKALRAALNACDWVERVDFGGEGVLDIHVNDRERAAREVLRVLADGNFPIERYEWRERTLEDVFMGLVGAGS